MNLGSLFNLGGADLVEILLIVLILHRGKRMLGFGDQHDEGRTSRDRFADINIVLTVIGFIAAMLLLNFLVSSH